MKKKVRILKIMFIIQAISLCGIMLILLGFDAVIEALTLLGFFVILLMTIYANRLMKMGADI